MSKLYFLGDVHGKFGLFEDILKDHQDAPIYQVGDMGVGYTKEKDEIFDGLEDKYKNFHFIRGNHDNPKVCSTKNNFIPDQCTEINGIKMMFINGASSIDRAWNTPGKSWWENEQSSMGELTELIDQFEEFKPDVVVSHTAPKDICEIMFGVGVPYSNMRWIGDAYLDITASCITDFAPRTEVAMNVMFEKHRPKFWIFGHWHMSRKKEIDGCTFKCLTELELIKLDYEKWLIL